MYILLSTIIATVILFMFWWINVVSLQNLRKALFCQDHFFMSANKLMKSDAVSDDISNMIVFIADAMVHKAATWMLLLAAVKLLFSAAIDGIFRRNASASNRSALHRQVGELSPDLNEAFFSAIAFGFLRASYNDVFAGFILRAILMVSVSKPAKNAEKAEKVTLDWYGRAHA